MSFTPTRPSALVPGQRLERYELLCPVAQGGMAWVWLARLHGAHGFEKLVAVKTILPDYASDPRFQKMFLDEAHIASGIVHGNVAQILDLGEADDMLYLVMAWVDGDSLSHLQQGVESKGGTLPCGIALRIMADACGGLHAAHELHDKDGRNLGVVHRDVSPHNILVDDSGSAKLIDFGIAKARDRHVEATSAGHVKGKLNYMAPEQALGKAIDRRADVWAVGAVLYDLLSGRPPYEGPNPLATLHLLTSGRAPFPMPKSVPGPVVQVIERALSHAVEERFSTALEMQTALEQAMVTAGCATTIADVSAFLRRELAERIDRRKQAVRMAIDAAADRDKLAALFTPAPSLSAATLAGESPSSLARSRDGEVTLPPDDPAKGGNAPLEIDRSSFAPLRPSAPPSRDRSLSGESATRSPKRASETPQRRRVRFGAAAMVAVGALLIAGALLELTAHGAFLRRDIVERLHPSRSAAHELEARRRALEGFGAESCSDANAALDALARAVDAAPRHAPLVAYAAYAQSAHQLRWGNDARLAARATALLGSIDGSPPEKALALGAHDLVRGDHGAARRWIDAAVATNVSPVEAAALLGELELRSGHPDRALVSYEKAIALRSDPRGRFGKTRALEALGERESARAEAEAIARDFAAHAGSRLFLARRAWSAARDEREATRWLDDLRRPPVEASASPGERVEAASLRGEIHLARGRLEDARVAYEDALVEAKGAPAPAAERGLGDVFTARREWAKAIAHYRAAIDAAPDLAEARRGLEHAQKKLATPSATPSATRSEGAR